MNGYKLGNSHGKEDGVAHNKKRDHDKELPSLTAENGIHSRMLSFRINGKKLEYRFLDSKFWKGYKAGYGHSLHYAQHILPRIDGDDDGEAW
jgi:hypothetical protein